MGWGISGDGLRHAVYIRSAGLKKNTNHRKIIVHAPIMEFEKSVIRKRYVILKSVAFLTFLLRKKENPGKNLRPPIPCTLRSWQEPQFYEIQPPNNYVKISHCNRISVICQKQLHSFASSRYLWLLVFFFFFFIQCHHMSLWTSRSSLLGMAVV
jgi:hypothetical protein